MKERERANKANNEGGGIYLKFLLFFFSFIYMDKVRTILLLNGVPSLPVFFSFL